MHFASSRRPRPLTSGAAGLVLISTAWAAVSETVLRPGDDPGSHVAAKLETIADNLNINIVEHRPPLIRASTWQSPPAKVFEFHITGMNFLANRADRIPTVSSKEYP